MTKNILFKNKKTFATTLGAFVFLFLFSFNSSALAQTVQTTSDAKRAQLESDLKRLEAEIEEQRKILSVKQRESVSLERDIAILDAKISEANLSIKARDITISKLSGDIGVKQKKIGFLSKKIDIEKESLAQMMRKTDQIDDSSAIELILGNRNISEFFSDLDDFESIEEALNTSFDVIKTDKKITSDEKRVLEDKKAEEVDLRKIQELQRKRIQENKLEKNRILAQSKGKEKEYQKILKAKEGDAAAIRSALFGLRGSTAISFGKALEYANVAYKKTGVRPAFLLGIITEETNLGENVGTGNWKVDMHPTRDVPVFADITSRLGLNPDKMPVSKKPWYGWGGAMGPAQFIPSTWVLYEKRISAMTGNTPPSPWDPEDAFMASAILLKDNGAIYGDYSSERLAALRYLAGWGNANKKAYAFYGDDVMELAVKYQRQIDILQGN